MKGLVFSYIGLSTHAIHKLAKLPLACGQRALWQAQWMGVVRLTQCQAHSAARLYGSTQAWKNDTFFFFFHKPHLFYIRHSQQPQRRHFLASRKPAWTINRMCLTCSPMFFFQSRILSCFGFLILHLCEGYKNIQVLNHVSCSSERFIGLPALHFVTLTHQMKTRMNLWLWKIFFLICCLPPSKIHSWV